MADPLCYFEEYHRAEKHHRINPHARSASETFSIMEKHWEKADIQRVADITGLDRIGIPVCNAIKPAMLSSAVQHGKGLTLEGARLSAIMEAFERYYGSKAQFASFHASYTEAAQEHRMIPYERLPKAKKSIFHAQLKTDWVMGFDIMQNEPVAVPLELVRLDPHGSARRLPSLQIGSNGLAAATEFAEATSQALLEIIERDAITCDHYRSKAYNWSMPLDLIRWRSIKHPQITPLLEKVRQADMLPLLFCCTIDTNIPTYNCYLLDLHSDNEAVYHGMGAGMDEATAITRAVTEAAQSRLAVIAGTRDNLFCEEAFFHRLSSRQTILDFYGGEDAGRDLHSLGAWGTDTFEGDIAVCLQELKNIGIEQVIVLRMTPADLDFVVVRVIVPGMEGYMLPLYTPGERAMAMYEYALKTKEKSA